MKTLNSKFAVLYNFSYMAIGSLTPLIGQYLKSVGFTGSQIGTITAAGTAAAIIASAFWGDRYSRTGKKHELLIMLCLMASLICLTLEGINNYYIFIAAFGMMYFFQAPVMSLTDAFTVERMQRFGPLRAWGAVGFALGVFLAGNAADKISIETIFVFYIGSFIITAITIWMIKRTEVRGQHQKIKDSSKEEKNPTAKGGYLKILRNKRIRQLIICAFFMGGTNVANNTYFSFLYIEGGGSVAGVGAAMLLMVGSEVPFMAWCEKLSAKLTMEKMILAAMIISVVRFILYGMGLPWWMLIILSFSQGAVNGILLIEFVRYVSAIAPEGYKSLAISSYYIIGSNLSTIFCQITGGKLLDVFGASGVYLFFGIFNFIGVVLYLKFRLYIAKNEPRKKLKKVEKSR